MILIASTILAVRQISTHFDIVLRALKLTTSALQSEPDMLAIIVQSLPVSSCSAMPRFKNPFQEKDNHV
jgi:hypothetical protein